MNKPSKTFAGYAAVEFLRRISERAGSYVGEGTNHEGDTFRGSMVIEPTASRVGVRLTYIAKGTAGAYEGVVLHVEDALLAPQGSESMMLCSVHSNAKSLIVHPATVVEERDTSWVAIFDSGPPDTPGGLHERIHITLWRNGDVSYDYEWAVGEMNMAMRSHVRMPPAHSHPPLSEAES